ncbi:hypothetical protein [Pararhizobium arenae]|uniref:hypothetical protein n=1 Tax=Pararhizobium arenae TaxID=1856850 RepID=UPI00117A4E8B|nr:hypothetical protein [Pararhizobium arenae]
MMRNSQEWDRLPSDIRNVIASFQDQVPVKIGELAKYFGLEVKISTLDVGISGMIFPSGNLYKILINKHEPSY